MLVWWRPKECKFRYRLQCMELTKGSWQHDYCIFCWLHKGCTRWICHLVHALNISHVDKPVSSDWDH